MRTGLRESVEGSRGIVIVEGSQKTPNIVAATAG
jgi:hypothetical protein